MAGGKAGADDVFGVAAWSLVLLLQARAGRASGPLGRELGHGGAGRGRAGGGGGSLSAVILAAWWVAANEATELSIA